ncbi:glucose-6-phosphate exchanger SLC37A2 isoform X2 [Dermatophagoides farinae]|uniref:glucose-6-phosphate exchanger SLC37A2 isoform X2 n=1 Tax=Dermatophagoides farinae TaxID=6954 RepID=UPI003F642C63
MLRIPIGIHCFIHERFRSLNIYRSLVLLLTYLAYASYHLSRRPFSIVKSVLTCTDNNNHTSNNCGWPPFNQHDSETLLGLLDSAFLFAYAFGMFFSGFLAERCNLRYFLAMGMLLSGLLNYTIGLAFYYNIHSLSFFIIFQILSGILQTTGWPAVVTCIGHWFSKSSRGVLFGIWNSHTNVGNILGAIVAGAFVDYNWGLSFMIPGLIIGLAGFLIFLFLVPRPEDVGIPSAIIHGPSSNHLIISDQQYPSESIFQSSEDSGVYGHNNNSVGNSDSHNHRRIIRNNDIESNMEEDSPLLCSLDDSAINVHIPEKNAISFFQALKIPGVIEFSICLFFAKLVSYTFLFWLPFYINYSMHSSSSNSAFLSAFFDLGGIIGGILAGFIVDRYGASAITCVGMLSMAIPSLLLYYNYGNTSNMMNIILQIITGTFVNGPYALITTAVSAELGTKVKSSQALATVTAIIDGTGSMGAAIGPLLSGPLARIGWSYVFVMVIISDTLALLSLLRIARQEYLRLRAN